MDKHELLVRELAKLGAVGGLGGAAGARLAAQYLPTECHRSEIRLHARPEAVLVRAYNFLCNEGRVIEAGVSELSPCPLVAGTIGSGFWRLNPTILQAEVVKADGEKCVVLVTAAAKEGLIKQRSAAKAVRRLVAALGSFAEQAHAARPRD